MLIGKNCPFNYYNLGLEKAANFGLKKFSNLRLEKAANLGLEKALNLGLEKSANLSLEKAFNLIVSESQTLSIYRWELFLNFLTNLKVPDNIYIQYGSYDEHSLFCSVSTSPRRMKEKKSRQTFYCNLGR